MGAREVFSICCFCNRRKVCRNVSKFMKGHFPDQIRKRSSKICSTCRKTWKSKTEEINKQLENRKSILKDFPDIEIINEETNIF
jgi:hypothetical protein